MVIYNNKHVIEKKKTNKNIWQKTVSESTHPILCKHWANIMLACFIILSCFAFPLLIEKKKWHHRGSTQYLKKLTSTPNIFLQKPQKAENT